MGYCVLDGNGGFSIAIKNTIVCVCGVRCVLCVVCVVLCVVWCVLYAVGCCGELWGAVGYCVLDGNGGFSIVNCAVLDISWCFLYFLDFLDIGLGPSGCAVWWPSA